MAATTFMRTWQDFDLIQLVILPLFLFSGTFYPMTTYPEPIRLLVQLTPLYHGVDLVRGLTTGALEPGILVHVAYLATMGILGPGDHLAAAGAPPPEVGARQSGCRRHAGRGAVRWPRCPASRCSPPAWFSPWPAAPCPRRPQRQVPLPGPCLPSRQWPRPRWVSRLRRRRPSSSARSSPTSRAVPARPGTRPASGPRWRRRRRLASGPSRSRCRPGTGAGGWRRPGMRPARSASGRGPTDSTGRSSSAGHRP